MVIKERHGLTKLEIKPCRKKQTGIHAPRTYLAQNASKPGNQFPNSTNQATSFGNHLRITSYIQTCQLTDITPYIETSSGLHHDVTSVTSQATSLDFVTSTTFSPPNVPLEQTEDIYAERTNVTSFDSWSYVRSLPYTSSPSTHQKNQSESLSFSNSFGCKKLTLLFLYVIVSMLILSRECHCVSLCSSTPPHLQVNESKICSDPGQCLIMTGSVVKEICVNVKKDKGKRRKLLRGHYTPFCGLPLSIFLSKSEKDKVISGGQGSCSEVLTSVECVDNETRELYGLFTNIMARTDCKESYSVKGTCSKCKEAYRQWLCSLRVKYYLMDSDQPIKPCVDFCDRVTENCPFFRPHGDTVIGEPGFICKDSNIHQSSSAAIYGPPGCCYKPCHVFTSLSDPGHAECPVTSNCTVESSTNRGSGGKLTPQSLTLVYHVLTSIAVSLFIQTVSLNSCIGLT